MSLSIYIKTKKMRLIILLSAILLLATPMFASQKIKEAYIKREIRQANHCQVDADCRDAGGKCPFGCYAYVNRNEADRISRLIGSYKSNCIYGCISCPTAECKNGRCEPVCDK